MRYKYQYNEGWEVFLEDCTGFSYVCDCPTEGIAIKVRDALNIYLYEGNDREAFDEIPDYCDLFEVNKFKEMCKNGEFVDADGSGYYAFSDKMTRVPAKPSSFVSDFVDDKFTHVAWFNK